MASNTILMPNVLDSYTRTIYTNTGGTIHIIYDSANLDALFYVIASRAQNGYAPCEATIFKKSGDVAPGYIERHSDGTTGTATTINSIAKETNGVAITFNLGYIRAIITGNCPFTLSAS